MMPFISREEAFSAAYRVHTPMGLIMMNVRMDMKIMFLWELMCTEPLEESPGSLSPIQRCLYECRYFKTPYR